MAERRIRGCLVAVEGADSVEVADLATELRAALTERQLPVLVSRWDASALFTDVVAAPVEHRDVSPRTLMLLYAADLAFRLRWEIAPALAAGQIVVAGPYTLTAVTFGMAAGLSQEWLTTLLRFMPQPARTAVLRERDKSLRWKRRPERGFCECCTTLLEATPEGFARRKTRSAMVSALETMAERHGGFYRPRHRRDLLDHIVKLHRRQAAATHARRRAS